MSKENPEANVKLWIRLGTTLDVTLEQSERILQGNQDVLTSVLLTQGKWRLEWESYIPEEFIDEFCAEQGLDPKRYGGSVDFNLGLDVLAAVSAEANI